MQNIRPSPFDLCIIAVQGTLDMGVLSLNSANGFNEFLSFSLFQNPVTYLPSPISFRKHSLNSLGIRAHTPQHTHLPRQHLLSIKHSACSNRGGGYDASTLPTFQMRLDDLQSANLITSKNALRWLDLQGCLAERSALEFFSLYIHPVP